MPGNLPAIESTRKIDPEDTMKVENEEHYFAWGRSAMNLVDGTLTLLMRDRSSVNTILDFACGHGRVLRALRGGFPQAKIYAADIDEKGIANCARDFDAVPVVSNANVHKIKLDDQPDLIWVGSLFTHMSERDWRRTFEFFSNLLNEKGILLFTYASHYVASIIEDEGSPSSEEEHVQHALRQFSATGYGFMPYKGWRKAVWQDHLYTALGKSIFSRIP